MVHVVYEHYKVVSYKAARQQTVLA